MTTRGPSDLNDMADSLWENSFKDFLLSDFGKELIVKSFDRRDQNEQHSAIDRTIYSVFFNGLTIGDSCALMLLPLKSQPGQTISRCHKILTEIGKQTLEEKGIKFPQNLVKGSFINDVTQILTYSDPPS